MEKYSQFRDKGTGIAPFFPIPTAPSGVYLPFHILLFILRVPVLLTVALAYFLVFAWLPIGSLGKKAALWLILGVPGIWWVDLQIDGVKKGSLGKQKSLSRLPQPCSIIVSSSTSPIDSIYLSAIFDPIFTISYPHTRLLRQTTLFSSILYSLAPPSLRPPPNSNSELTTLASLIKRHPTRTILLFSECTTTNGRAILPLSPSLLTAPKGCKVFPISLRYAAPDVMTPVPGWSEAARFLWNLCSRPTHTIRVRVAEAVVVDTESEGMGGSDVDVEGDVAEDGEVMLMTEEKKVLDRVGEALSRLGRVTRVSVGVREKVEFVKMWNRRRR